MKVAVILVACMFSGPTEIFGQAENDITRFAQGLRARRLFDIAESYCRDGLANRELDPTTQTSLTLELIRTQSARAAISSGSKRKQSWAEAKQTAEDFLSANPNHPRKLLVQVQSALTYLAHGRLLRQEIEAEIAPTSVRDQALPEIPAADAAGAGRD